MSKTNLYQWKVFVKFGQGNILHTNEDWNGLELLKFIGTNSVNLNNSTYKFDLIFHKDTEKRELYQLIAEPTIENILEGYNVAFLIYGEDLMGKMDYLGNLIKKHSYGIIPTLSENIFKKLQNNLNNNTILIKVTYFGIKGDQIIDLLDVNKKLLKLTKDILDNFDINDITEKFANSYNELIEILWEGNIHKNKHIQENKASDYLFDCIIIRITLFQINLNNLVIIKSQISFIELTERKNMNPKSFSCLKEAVDTLDKGIKPVPVEDCHLTRVLKCYLDGNSIMNVLLCCPSTNIDQDILKEDFELAEKLKSLRSTVTKNENWDTLYKEMTDKLESMSNQMDTLKVVVFKLKTGDNSMMEMDLDSTNRNQQYKNNIGFLIDQLKQEKIYETLRKRDEQICILENENKKLKQNLENTKTWFLKSNEENEQLRSEKNGLLLKVRKLMNDLQTLKDHEEKQEEYYKSIDKIKNQINDKYIKNEREIQKKTIELESKQVENEQLKKLDQQKEALLKELIEKIKIEIKNISYDLNNTDINAYQDLSDSITELNSIIISLTYLKDMIKIFIQNHSDDKSSFSINYQFKINQLENEIENLKNSKDTKMIGIINDNKVLEKALINMKIENIQLQAHSKLSESHVQDNIIEIQLKKILEHYLTEIELYKNSLKEKIEEIEDLNKKFSFVNSEVDMYRNLSKILLNQVSIEDEDTVNNFVIGKLEKEIENFMNQFYNVKQEFLDQLKMKVNSFVEKPSLQDVISDPDYETKADITEDFFSNLNVQNRYHTLLCPDQHRLINNLQKNICNYANYNVKLKQEITESKIQLNKLHNQISSLQTKNEFLDQALVESYEKARKYEKKYYAKFKTLVTKLNHRNYRPFLFTKPCTLEET